MILFFLSFNFSNKKSRSMCCWIIDYRHITIEHMVHLLAAEHVQCAYNVWNFRAIKSVTFCHTENIIFVSWIFLTRVLVFSSSHWVRFGCYLLRISVRVGSMWLNFFDLNLYHNISFFFCFSIYDIDRVYKLICTLGSEVVPHFVLNLSEKMKYLIFQIFFYYLQFRFF